MSGDPQERLRSHVDAILAHAGVPARQREELSEELYGHLVERWTELMAGGLDADQAADRAVGAFGTPSELAGQLRDTYHGRLWASTIGVLLPVVAPTSSRPGTVGWLRFVLFLVAALTMLSVIAIPVLSPVQALGIAVSAVLGVTGAGLAFMGLARRQAWALRYAIAASFLLLIEGLVAVASRGPSELVIPLGSILAGLVLFSAWRRWSDLLGFVAPSTALGGKLSVLLVVALLAPPLVPRALAAVPDPTAATPGDLDLRLEMTCDRGDVEQLNAPTLRNVRRATLMVDATWSKADVLPLGIAGWLTGADDADTSGLRVINPTRPILPLWLWADEPTIVDLATGESVGWWGSTSSGWTLLPDDVIGTFTVAIDSEDLQAGHTIRTTWVLVHGDNEPEWPEVEVFYAHLDRFALAGTVGCNGISHGVLIDGPPPAPITDDGLLPY